MHGQSSAVSDLVIHITQTLNHQYCTVYKLHSLFSPEIQRQQDMTEEMKVKIQRRNEGREMEKRKKRYTFFIFTALLSFPAIIYSFLSLFLSHAYKNEENTIKNENHPFKVITLVQQRSHFNLNSTPYITRKRKVYIGNFHRNYITRDRQPNYLRK